MRFLNKSKVKSLGYFVALVGALLCSHFLFLSTAVAQTSAHLPVPQREVTTSYRQLALRKTAVPRDALAASYKNRRLVPDTKKGLNFNSETSLNTRLNIARSWITSFSNKAVKAQHRLSRSVSDNLTIKLASNRVQRPPIGTDYLYIDYLNDKRKNKRVLKASYSKINSDRNSLTLDYS